MFGNLGGGITEPKSFWNYFGNIFVCNGSSSFWFRLFLWGKWLPCVSAQVQDKGTVPIGVSVPEGQFLWLWLWFLLKKKFRWS